ncbi:hypothetical protein C1H46_006765 [Malus baccata]|uniref:Uncharacterized protein n=1 Tax=Malus baccata TaxID=106549 RepID=A0A540N9A1_MALBA|nr:hypothetical protein C1H46_006765 [Malus baccata]
MMRQIITNFNINVEDSVWREKFKDWKYELHYYYKTYRFPNTTFTSHSKNFWRG